MTQINQVQKRKSMTLTKKYLILVGFLKKTSYNARITEIKGKIPSIADLDTTADVSNLVNK